MRMTLADSARSVERSAEVPVAQLDPLELLSSIAHEIRAPLAALTASAEMMRSADGDTQLRFTQIIERQALRLNAIVEGLLEAYRAPRDQIQRIRDIVNVRELLDEIQYEHGAQFPRHTFTVTASGRATALLNRRLLSIVLGNLATNAAKYSPAGSSVALSCDVAAGRAVFRVHDEGPGVPAFLRKKIFEAGERGMFGGDSGCGLGLFIAQRLCDAIGAEIDVDENETGRGACFTVSIVG